MADMQFDWTDPLRLDSLLTDEERMVRESARRFCDDVLMPRVRDDFRHERFDRSVVRGMAELGFFGATLPESDGGAGLSHVAYGLIARELERVGFEATYLQPEPDGLLDLEKFKAAIRPDTVLASVMLVNNEIGVIQDIEAIGNVCRANNVVFHVDAAQATGKVAIDLEKLPVDLMSFSAHKTYGPKGIGALYVRRKPRIRLEAQIHGGGQERGFRSGTLATHQIVGMGEAFRLAREEMELENARIRRLRDRLLNGLQEIEEVYVNGDLKQRVPHNLNISFNYVEGESLIMAVKDIAVSSGSACTSASLEPSYVLRALGRSDELAHSSLRMTIGRFTTEEEVDTVVTTLKERVAKLRELSPLWDMYQEGIDLSTIQWSAH